MRDIVMVYLSHKAKRDLLAEMLYTRLNNAGKKVEVTAPRVCVRCAGASDFPHAGLPTAEVCAGGFLRL